MYAQIEVGHFYGYRRCPLRRGEPLAKIEILEKKKPGKWRVRFVEEGQKDVVTSSLVPWAEAEAFLEDERRMLKLLDACKEQWSGNPDDPIMDAVNLVLRWAKIKFRNGPITVAETTGRTKRFTKK